MEVVVLVFLLLSSSCLVGGQFNDCAMLQENELGSTSTAVTTGLLAQALSASSGDATISARLLQFNTVCLAQGTTRDTYRSLSLIAVYVDGSGVFEITQLHLQCINGSWSANNFGTTSTAASNPSTGTLDTPPRRDCIICANPLQLGGQESAEHCVACDSAIGCIGLRRCTGSSISDQTCCNYFDVSGACVTACPTNSSVGANFRCVCDPGFNEIGGTCIDIDECRIDPCANGGTCTNLVDAFSCSCAASFTGTTCETDVDECLTGTPCMNGGTCSNTFGGFNCSCVGFTGSLCDTDIDECQNSSACLNGGTCNNTVGGFTCSCLAGFTGSTCETDVDECQAGNPCLNGGTCINTPGNFNCTCLTGFTGATCETDINECQEGTPCMNGGTCTNFLGNFSCSCAVGFTGTTCQADINECLDNPCRNGGSCTNMAGTFSCSCLTGFTGATCETDIDECQTDNICMNDGTCVNMPGSFSCRCMAGFTGSTCGTDIDECETTTCENGGTCNDLVADFSCSCLSSYSGPTCNVLLDVCEATTCSNGGTCARAFNPVGYECTCAPGYTDSTCGSDIDECEANNPCMNGGTCTNTQGSFRCDCLPGWTGPTCEVCSREFCLECAGEEALCVTCNSGFILSQGACDPPNTCPVSFCEQCSISRTTCERCQNGFTLTLSGLCESNRINLSDIHIAAIVVSSFIVFILIVTLCMCFLSFVGKSISPSHTDTGQGGHVHKRKKPKKYLVKRKARKVPKETSETIVNTAVVNMEIEDEGEERELTTF